jgi:hypothetical protein
MQKQKKSSKPILVIIALIVCNILTFSVVSKEAKKSEAVSVGISMDTESNSYFKSGVNVLNWSYTLLKYFRQ